MLNINYAINRVVDFIWLLGYRTHSYPLPIGITTNEIKVLAKYCLQTPVGGVFVEIGSFFGGSACILAVCSQLRDKNEQIVSIDLFQPTSIDKGLGSVQNYNEIMSKIGCKNYLLINCNSNISRSEYDKKCALPISFLFIDGGHRYHECRSDFYAYEDLVMPGGYICFHDCGDTTKEDLRSEEEILKENREYDVTPFCARLCEKHPNYKCIEKVGDSSIYVVQKNNDE